MTEYEILEYMRQKTYKPLTLEELLIQFDVGQPDDFQKLLEKLEQQGKVIKTRKKKFGLPEKMGLVIGRLQGHSKGFGFLLPDDRQLADVYISAENLNTAMHQDRVVVRYLGSLAKGQKPEGEVIRVLERKNTKVVGTMDLSKQFGFVIPDERKIGRDIFVTREDINEALDGQKVVVEVTKWPQKGRNPEGRVIELLGDSDAPGVDILSIIRKYDLPEEFPGAVLAEASQIPMEIQPEETENRKDLRSLKMVTIDGEDAKDLDDAVSIEALEQGLFLLGVHIADVSHYVREKSRLDKEAFARGTSVYLADRVIPMLPPRLSNGICSLNAGEDRLAMTAMMKIDRSGRILSYDIFPSLIHVRHRMTYGAVNRILIEKDQELRRLYADFVPEFEMMEELCHILRDKRLRRGAVDFDFPESKVKLDETGKPLEIIKLERQVGEKMIEEFMLAANETVARHIQQMELPFVYRVHEEPEEEKVSKLQEFLEPLGYGLSLKGSKPQPRVFQKLLEQVKGKAEERLISTAALRTMQHARYAPYGLGHFGLATAYYCHFTSPIRRYPDLIVHRVLHKLFKEGFASKEVLHWQEKTALFAEQSSERERKAEEAERETLDLKKVEYMQRHLGETFEGVISGVTNFGFFVELENTVEGLVHVSALTDDYYDYLENLMALMGQHTRKMYRVGDAVHVQVVKVNIGERQVDFELVN